MLTPDRGPMVIEWNCRFGDPETQAVLVRMEDDLLPWLVGAAAGRLPRGRAALFAPGAAVCVVLAAAGYPGTPRPGDAITGIARPTAAEPPTGSLVFHAGTRPRDGGAGHRRRAGAGRDRAAAPIWPRRAARAYGASTTFASTGMHFRRDIGLRGDRT